MPRSIPHLGHAMVRRNTLSHLASTSMRNVVIERKQPSGLHLHDLFLSVNLYLARGGLNRNTPCRLMFVKTSSGFKRNQDNSKVGVLYDRVRGMLRLPWLLRLEPTDFLSYVKAE